MIVATSPNRRALLAFALMLSLALFAASHVPSIRRDPGPATATKRSPSGTVEQYPRTGSLDRQSRPVSIVALKPDTFAFVDYKNLYVLAFVGPERECRMIRPNIALPADYYDALPSPFEDSPEVRLKPANVNPTGLWYDAADGSLYIANYGMRDILVGRFSENFRRLRIEKILRHPALVSPENVAVSRADNIIAVADFDAPGLLVFDLAGKLLWRRVYSGSHGVTIHDGHIYLCNMTDATRLAKFDFAGNLLASCRTVGRADRQFLYPSAFSIIPPEARADYGGPLLLVDAHQNSLTVLDEALRQVRRFDAADIAPAPGPALPYGVAAGRDFLALADTYNSRLVFSRHGSSQYQVVNLGTNYFVGSAPEQHYRPQHPHSSDQKAPQELADVVRRWVPGSYEVYLGHQALYLFDRHSDEFLTSVLLPLRTGKYGLRNRPGFGFNFSWATRVRHHGETYVVVGSRFPGEFPASVMVLEPRTGRYDCVPVPSGLSLRPMDGDTTDPLEKGLLHHFVTAFCAKLHEHDASPGQSPLTTFIDAHFKNIDDLIAHKEQLFYTRTGLNLFERWQRGEPIRLDVTDYYRASDPLLFDELFLLEMLSQSPRHPNHE